MRHGKAVYVSKTRPVSFEPMQSRSLLILSATYRGYGQLVIGALEALTETWRANSVYAGMQGLGTQGAWCIVACKVEGDDGIP